MHETVRPSDPAPARSVRDGQTPPCCKTHAGGNCHGSASHGDDVRRTWLAVGLLSVVTLVGLTAGTALGLIPARPQQGYEVISPTVANRMLAADAEAVFVDVRSRAEYVLQGHAVGTYNLPIMRWNDRTGGMDPNPEFVAQMAAKYGKDRTLVLICRSGHRSGRAAAALAEAGYTHLYSVQGGMSGTRDDHGKPVKGWQQEGLPMISDPQPERWLDGTGGV